MAWAFLTTIENIIETTEEDVLKTIIAIKTDAIAAEAAIQSGLQWVSAHAPQLLSDIQLVASAASMTPLASNPIVLTAIAGANAAVAEINTAVTAGASPAQTLLNGYAAVKTATAAAATAAAALASAKVATPAPAS